MTEEHQTMLWIEGACRHLATPSQNSGPTVMGGEQLYRVYSSVSMMLAAPGMGTGQVGLYAA